MLFGCATRDLNRVLAAPAKLGVSFAQLTVVDGRLIVLADDLDVRVTTWCDVTVESVSEIPGPVVYAPAHLLRDIAKQIPDGAVSVTFGAGSVTLSGSGVVTSVRTVPAEVANLPTAPARPDTTTELDIVAFRRAVTQVLPACSTDQSRGVLAGVSVAPSQGVLVLAGTDSYRLHVTETSAFDAPTMRATVIPAYAVRVLLTVFDGVDPVRLHVSKERVTIMDDHAVLTARCIMDPFPVYQKLLPETRRAVTHVTVDSGRLLDALSIANPMAKQAPTAAGVVTVTVTPEDNQVTVESSASDVGDTAVDIPAVSVKGEYIQFDANLLFLAAAVKSAACERVELWFTAPEAPVLVTGFGAAGYKAVVMPVRVPR